MWAWWGQVRLVGACAPGGGMCPRWGHVPQGGECAPGGGMSATWVHVHQVGACALGRGEVGVHGNILILVRSMYQSEYI